MATIYIQGPDGLKAYCGVAEEDLLNEVYLQGSSSLVEFTHKYGEPSYEWNETDSCTAKRICAYDSSHEDVAAATISSEVVSAVSCTTDGITDYTATFNESWAATQARTVTTSALGHTYSTTKVNPTCTEQGYTVHRCERGGCGYSYNDTFIGALGHTFGDWVVTAPATCTTTGVKKGTCTLCGHEETGAIPVDDTNHDWNEPTYVITQTPEILGQSTLLCTASRTCKNESSHIESTTAGVTFSYTAPTCTTDGANVATATFSESWAGTYTSSTAIPATGHSWTAATCTAPKTCSTCGATEGSALGHTASSTWETIVQPTITSTGTRVKKCTGCGTVMEEETIPKLDLKVPTIAATVELGKTLGNLKWDEITVTLTNPNSMALDYTINYSLTSSVSSRVSANNNSGTIAANSSVTHIVIPNEPDLQYGGNKDTTFGNCRIYAFFDDYPSISATKNVTGSTPEIEDTNATAETPEVGTYNLLASNALTVEGWEFVDSGNITNEGYTKSEVFYAGGYLEDNSSTVVPVLYKLWDDSSTDPDMDEPFFYVGQGTLDGVTCDKWRKIEADGEFTWTSTCKQYVYTNVIVSNSRFIDSIFGTSSETYPLTITINSTAYADPGSGVTTVGRVAYIAETTATEISTGETLTYGVTAVHTKYGRLKLSATGTNCNYSFVCIDESSGTYALTISNPTDAVTITINGTS